MIPEGFEAFTVTCFGRHNCLCFRTKKYSNEIWLHTDLTGYGVNGERVIFHPLQIPGICRRRFMRGYIFVHGNDKLWTAEGDRWDEWEVGKN